MPPTPVTRPNVGELNDRIDRRIIRMVKNVGGLRAKFQHPRLLQRNDFGERHIEQKRSWSNDAVTARISIGPGGRCDKGSSVEPFRDGRIR